jgi:hypothetical protein
VYDLFRPGGLLSPRKVLWLAGQLPPESALHASLRGGSEFRAWTPTAHLLAGVVNLLNAANRQRAGKRTRDPLVRPPTARPKARVLNLAEIAKRQRALEQAKN